MALGGSLWVQPLPLPQDSTLSEDSPPSSASPRLPGSPKCSYPYHTLSQSSDEVRGARGAGVSPPQEPRGPPADPRLTPVSSCWRSRRARPRAGRAARWGSGCRAWAWSATCGTSRLTAWTGPACCTSTGPSSRCGAGGSSRDPKRWRARGSGCSSGGFHRGRRVWEGSGYPRGGFHGAGGAGRVRGTPERGSMGVQTPLSDPAAPWGRRLRGSQGRTGGSGNPEELLLSGGGPWGADRGAGRGR